MTDAPQRSAEWFEARLGKVTASRIADVVARTKSGWGASRENYMAELICERLTGEPAAGYVSAAMQHGIDTEPEARAAYEMWTDSTVTEVGFVPHPEIAMSGASPDGLVGDDGLIEIKCPGTARHIKTLLGGTIDRRYLLQMQWQMACTGRAWCDFVSYDPRISPEMQLWIERVERDDETIDWLTKEVVAFLEELDEKLAVLIQRYNGEDSA